jgi:hypothetical protein
MNSNNTRLPWDPDKYLAHMSFESMTDLLGLSPRSLRVQISKKRINVANLNVLRKKLEGMGVSLVTNRKERGTQRLFDEDFLASIHRCNTKHQMRTELNCNGTRLNGYLQRVHGTTNLDDIKKTLGDSEGLI